ncbi:MAG: tyrosine-type recombinase/integrase [Planctomycetaceae bacterium]
MASISTDATGNRKIQFVNGDGKRKSVYLGKILKADAKEICCKIEAILAALLSRRSLAAEVAEWVGNVPDVLAEKLAGVGLIAPRVKQQKDATTFGSFIDAYLVSRTDIKPRTRINLLQVRRNLVTYFGETKPIADITPGDTDEWRRWMLTKLGENTVRRHCGRAKQLLRAALRKRIISENPFADMRDCLVKANKSREFFLSRADAEKVLAACPDNEWRLIFALARFGGLRTPSETLLLRWGDVDWERGRLLIRSPKTEHHEGKDSRLVPIFPELRPHLEAAWDQAADGAEFVVTRYRDGNANLRTQLLRIVAKAGQTAWPKLFQNLRSTRETELAETYPLHVVTSWLGNSQLIAAKHYLQVTDDHFQKATQNPTQSGTEMSESEGKPIIRPLRDNEKAPEFPGLSAACRFLHSSSVPPVGLEPTT